MNVDDTRVRALLRPAPDRWVDTTERRAAVLGSWFARDGEDWLLLMMRRHDLREHAGQIAFPGGRDSGDADPVACALREAQEEVGIHPDSVEVLGEVPPRISSSRYHVRCIIGRIEDPEPVRIDPREVERVLYVPLAQLCQVDRWYDHVPPEYPGLTPSPHFEFGGDVIWGLTGRFTRDLVDLLVKA